MEGEAQNDCSSYVPSVPHILDVFWYHFHHCCCIERYIIIDHIILSVNKFYIENRERHIIWNINFFLKRLILKNGGSTLLLMAVSDKQASSL